MGFLNVNELRGAGGPPPTAQGARPTCIDCTRKHVAQAIVLMQEAQQGYPDHRWLAVGHLGEAADESVGRFPALAARIRQARLAIMQGGSPPLMDLIREASALAH